MESEMSTHAAFLNLYIFVIYIYDSLKEVEAEILCKKILSENYFLTKIKDKLIKLLYLFISYSLIKK